MSDPNGEAFEIGPSFDNPILRISDPDNELGSIVRELADQRTSPGYEALVSDLPTEEVAETILESAKWAALLRYETRAEDFLGIFERFDIPETDDTADLYSQYRHTKMLFLLRTRPLSDILPSVREIVAEERAKHHSPKEFQQMLREVAEKGDVESFREWLFMVYGDLAKPTPDETDRYDYLGEDTHRPITADFYSVLNSAVTELAGFYGRKPDPFAIGELVDIVEAFCKRDQSHELSILLLGNMEFAFNSQLMKELGIHQRCERLYKKGLLDYLRLRIPSLQGNVLGERYTAHHLSSLIELGWKDLGFRKEVDGLLMDLEARNHFDDATRNKITQWKADRRRKTRRKGAQVFSWDDTSKPFPRHF